MTVSPLTKSPHSLLYEEDYCLWLETMAKLLKEQKFQELDLENLIDEIESMVRSDKRALESDLIVVLLHLLKYRYQPEKRSKSWLSSIREHRRRLRRLLKDSPSLKPYFATVFTEGYLDARKAAKDETGLPLETFPVECPFTPEEVLDEDFLPD